MKNKRIILTLGIFVVLIFSLFVTSALMKQKEIIELPPLFPVQPYYMDRIDLLREYYNGITTDETYLFAIASTEGVIDKYDMDGNYIGNFSIGNCNGITTDGTYLWVGCNGNTISKYYTNGTYLSTFNYLGNSIYDLEVNGNYLWVSDSITPLVSKYYKNGTYISNFTSNTTGSIAISNNYIWLSNMSIICSPTEDGGITCAVDSQTIKKYSMSGTYMGSFNQEPVIDVDLSTTSYSMGGNDYLWILVTRYPGWGESLDKSQLLRYQIASDM